jgi:hypothetical protein
LLHMMLQSCTVSVCIIQRVTMIAQRTAYIQYHRLHSCHWNEKKNDRTGSSVYVWIDAWCNSRSCLAAAAKPLSMQFDMDLYPDRTKRQLDHHSQWLTLRIYYVYIWWNYICNGDSWSWRFVG